MTAEYSFFSFIFGAIEGMRLSKNHYTEKVIKCAKQLNATSVE